MVNGVDVTPYVKAELDRRYPERQGFRAEDAEGLSRAWSEVRRDEQARVGDLLRDVTDKELHRTVASPNGGETTV